MTQAPTYADVEKGAALPTLTVHVGRGDLVRYAGASGDFNPIHWSSRAAQALGLPDVIAHGMLTMAHAARVVTDWTGDPARVVEFSVRFTKPVVVPETADIDESVEVTYTGAVADKLDDGRVRIDLTGQVSTGEGSEKVLGAARAVVRLD